MKELHRNNSFIKYAITLNQKVRSYMQIYFLNLIISSNSLLSNKNKSPSIIPYDVKMRSSLRHDINVFKFQLDAKNTRICFLKKKESILVSQKN